MHFTVVFNSHESHDLSYGLVFTPCPIWKKGNKELINLHPDEPQCCQLSITPSPVGSRRGGGACGGRLWDRTFPV